MNEEICCITNEKKKWPRMNGKMMTLSSSLYTVFIKN